MDFEWQFFEKSKEIAIIAGKLRAKYYKKGCELSFLDWIHCYPILKMSENCH